MFQKRHLCVLVLLFVVFLSTTLWGDIDQRTKEYISQFNNRTREILQGGSRSLFNNYNRGSRDLVITERVFQYVDWYTFDWMNWDKEYFVYDEQGRLSSVPLFFWDDFQEEWYQSPITTNIYWNNDLIDQLIITYEMNSETIYFLVYTQSYNQNGQVTEIVQEFYDYDEEELLIGVVFQFHYDNSGYVDLIALSIYDDDYPLMANISITYDNNQRMHELIDETSLDGENWFLSERTIISYHQNDQSGYNEVQSFFNHLSLYFALDDITWLPEPMYSEELFYEWEEEWLLYEREIFTYYPNNLLETSTFEEYLGGGMWEPWDRRTYYYDNQDYLQEMLFQYYDDEWFNHDRILYTWAELTDVEDIYQKPADFAIANYPNPFNPETTIRFELPESQEITLYVVNIKGQKVKTLLNESKQTGTHNIIWDGRDERGTSLPSGIYFYCLEGESVSGSGKMLLLK